MKVMREALHLVKWYAQEHVLLCLVPAFFIAGAVGVFVSQAAVMKYLGPKANKVLAYGVASVSGSILAVCSCTILFALALAAILVAWFKVKKGHMLLAAAPAAALALILPEHPALVFVAATISLSILTATAKESDGDMLRSDLWPCSQLSKLFGPITQKRFNAESQTQRKA